MKKLDFPNPNDKVSINLTWPLRIVISLIILYVLYAIISPSTDIKNIQVKESYMPVSNLIAGGKEIKNAHPTWPDNICNAIAQEVLLIGMTEDQVIASWNRPYQINTTKGSFGIHEQWVMSAHIPTDYLYFENGILTSIQESSGSARLSKKQKAEAEERGKQSLSEFEERNNKFNREFEERQERNREIREKEKTILKSLGGP